MDRTGATGWAAAWRRGRWARWVGLAIAGLAALGFFGRFLFLGNFDVVAPGRVYRSAQPKGSDLTRWMEAHALASIVNLRGGSGADSWYRDEVRQSERRGVDLYDLPMDANRRPSRRELLTLIDVLDRCRYPLLIHCKSGSDRTGLASALYLMLRDGRPPGEARGAFSLARGHLPLFGAELLHEPLVEYEDWLRERGLAHEPSRFRDWVRREYRDPDPSEDFRPLSPGSRFRVAEGGERRSR